MAQVTSLINGNNINQDKHFSALTQSTKGVISGLTVTSTEVTPGKAFVEVLRTSVTPNETFLVLFENTTTLNITAGNNKYIIVEINQANINDGTDNEEDGTGIGEIKVVDTLPAGNYIELARTDGIGDIITTNRDIARGKGETPHSIEYIDGNGVKQSLALGTSGQVLTSAGATNTPNWTSPAVDIGGLTPTTTLNSTDEFIVNQSGNKKITADNLGKNLKVPATKSTFVAGENITAGNALYIHTDGKVYKTDATNSSKINFIGFATNTATTGNNVIVDTSGVSATQTGLTVGSDYYLSNPNLDIQATSGSRFVGWQSGTGGKQGQSFIALSNLTLNSLQASLNKQGTPTSSIGCQIYASDKTTLLATSTNSFASGDLLTSFARKTFNFSGLSLTGGIEYFIVFYKLNGTFDVSNYYNIESSSSSIYYGGSGYQYDSSWVLGDYDLNFNITFNAYGTISTTPGTNVRRVGVATSTTSIQLETDKNDSLDGATSTTATTGSVTLGNAVGYITVKINGVNRKIPYYS